MLDIRANLRAVQERVAAACARANRRSGDVLLIGVSKTLELEAIRRAVVAAQKGGVHPAELKRLLDAITGLKYLEVRGLMCIPPAADSAEASRPWFRRLRELRDAVGLEHCSMGMSGDFEVAIEEGATMVRVGTAIFGPRPPRPAVTEGGA